MVIDSLSSQTSGSGSGSSIDVSTKNDKITISDNSNTLSDSDDFLSGNAETNPTTMKRSLLSSLWTYIKNKISSVLGLSENGYEGSGTFGINRKPGSTIGNYSFAEGIGTTASGDGSHAEGNISKASGDYSHAEGNSEASGDYSHAESISVASSYGAHAEGFGTTASGQCSHAEGRNTTASGDGSHAEGYSTITSGDSSHAEGDKTTASNHCSHAEGDNTTASGVCSHAEGYSTTASGYYSHVQGKYNVVDSSDIYADIIGKGTDDSARKNIEATTWTGDKRLKGTVYVNCDDDSTNGYVLIRADSIAPTFSTSKTYSVGDCVTYGSVLYKCTTAHTAGNWDSTHFTATTIVELLNL